MSRQEKMEYEGFFTRLFCGKCQNSFDIEGDVTDGDKATCDACGEEGIIEGR